MCDCNKTEEIAYLKAKVEAHGKWNERQNGSLNRIEKKVDKITWLLIVTLAGLLVQIGLRLL